MCCNFSNWKLKIMGYFPFPCGAFMSRINIMKCSSQRNNQEPFTVFIMRDPQWGEGGEQKRSHDIMQLSYIRVLVWLLMLSWMLSLLSQSRERNENVHLSRMGSTVSNLSQLQRKKGNSLISWALTMTWRPSAHAFLGMRACLTLFLKVSSKDSHHSLCETCIRLKCRTEALQRLIVIEALLRFRWDPPWGSWTHVLPTWQPCHWGSPLLGMIWDTGAVCPQTLIEGLEPQYQKTTLATGFTPFYILQEIFVSVLLERSPATPD